MVGLLNVWLGSQVVNRIHLSPKAEGGIKTAVPGGKKEIPGGVDYATGHGEALDKSSVGSLAVVEASSYGTIALAQCVAYISEFHYISCTEVPGGFGCY